MGDFPLEEVDINLPRTYEKLYWKEKQYLYSAVVSEILCNTQINIVLLFYKDIFFNEAAYRA